MFGKMKEDLKEVNELVDGLKKTIDWYLENRGVSE